MRFLIFGDSITQGYFDSRGGWASRLCQELQDNAIKDLDRSGDIGFNLGISGNMASDVLARLGSETSVRSKKKDATTIILAVGINDSALQEARVRVDEYEFQKIYEKLLDEASKLASMVVCVGLSAVDESLTSPLSYSTTGITLKNNRINLFEDCIKQLAVGRDVTFVPIFRAFKARMDGGESLLADGLHPNDAGHELILSEVKAALKSF